jgi:hypothetical protein
VTLDPEHTDDPCLLESPDGTVEIWMNGAARVTVPSPEAEGLHALEQTERGLTELSVIEWYGRRWVCQRPRSNDH